MAYFLIVPESVNMGEVERKSEIQDFANEDEFIRFILDNEKKYDFDDCTLIVGKAVSFSVEINVDIHIDDV